MAPIPTVPATLDVPVVSWSSGARGDAKSRRTRRSLLLAAAREIAVHGYAGASLSGILRAAQLTKGALYFHFKNKEELGRGVVAEMFGSWAELVAGLEARELDPMWMLLVECDAYIGRRMFDPLVRAGGRVIAESGLFETMRSEWGRTWTERTAELTTAAKEAGLLRPSVQPGHLARTVVALATGHFYLAESTPDAGNYRERMDDMWEGVIPVVTTDEWCAGWERSCWRSRPAPDPQWYVEARRP